jgi:hypothetical protein
MNRRSTRCATSSAAKLSCAIAFAAAMGSGVALADDHTPAWQHSSYDRHPQAHGHASHHPPSPRYRNDWHGYNRGYRYRDPYYDLTRDVAAAQALPPRDI